MSTVATASYAKRELNAYELRGESLVLGGKRVRHSDLVTHDALQEQKAALHALAAEMEHRLAGIESELQKFQAAMQKTQAAIEQARDTHTHVQLERVANKRGQRWYAGGQRVAAENVGGVAGGRRSVTEARVPIEVAVQKMRDDLDALMSGSNTVASE